MKALSEIYVYLNAGAMSVDRSLRSNTKGYGGKTR
jgi:hypothetical protein